MESVISIHWLISVVVFACVFLFTPGPNNIMFANSGSVYGYRKTLPHIFGVALGAPIILLAISTGGYHLFQYPWFRYTFQTFSIIYLIWLAFKIARATPPHIEGATKPLNFMQGALFQWLNPKVWAQFLIAMGVYLTTDQNFIPKLLVMVVAFSLLGLASGSVWTFFGKLIAKDLSEPQHYRIFNRVMAVLLVLTVLPVFVEHLG